MNERIAGARVHINLDALVRNWKHMDKLSRGNSPKAKASAVVKADGYGLGLEPVVAALHEAGCSTFFVAYPDEGIRAKRVAPDAEVFVFNGLIDGSEAFYAEAGIIPVLCSLEDIDRWAAYWRHSGQRRPCAINIDTGMNRLGLSMDDVITFCMDGTRKHSVTAIMVMSHPACADEPDDPMNRLQLERFIKASGHFSGSDLSFANSAAIQLGSDFTFDLTRPGIALYGGESINGRAALEPVVTLEGRILQVRTAMKGERVGYGGTHTLERESRIAVVGAGYADGLHRSQSGSGVPLRDCVSIGGTGFVAGYRVPMIGRMSMDLTAFDVTDVPQQVLEQHDWIELVGPNIALDDAARAAGTIGYELLTSLGRRYHRIYDHSGCVDRSGNDTRQPTDEKPRQGKN